jgi:hypothetical protein
MSYRNLIAIIAITVIGLGIGVAKADSLYVGDSNDNTVKRFDASTGNYLGVFVNHNGCPQNPPSPPPQGCLYGPTGLIFDGPGPQGHLLVADQNVNLNIPGAIYEYNSTTGSFIKALVPPTSKYAPPAPRGIILYPRSGGTTLFVASPSGVTADPTTPGSLQAFDGTSGAFIDSLPSTSSFHPRGVVIGTDGLLYVSNDPGTSVGNGGEILRYSPETLNFIDTFVDNVDCNCDFNRPEGLVFGPDGNLYVTSFRSSPSDTDKILIFAGPSNQNPRTLLSQIVLDQVGQDRAYAQALLFGPGPVSNRVYLFVPVTTPNGPNAGQVRRYDVTDLSKISLDIFVPTTFEQNSPLGSSWYLTFRNTSPVTLDYSPP